MKNIFSIYSANTAPPTSEIYRRPPNTYMMYSDESQFCTPRTLIFMDTLCECKTRYDFTYNLRGHRAVIV